MALTIDRLPGPNAADAAQSAVPSPAGLRPDWAAEVRRLARAKDAVVLAHNYQVPEIQDVADHVGDSLALSRIAASVDQSTIVFCGVHFMAETAKILSPDKTVLIPDRAAGCSLADTITADQLRAWKAEHPGAVVVAYVNTTAAVKAETDVCCTSSNAADVIRSIPADKEILFLPDQFLGAHVRRVTGRDNIHIWSGECHVHAGIDGGDLRARIDAEPDAEAPGAPGVRLRDLGAVPGRRPAPCPPSGSKILSTGGMLEEARRTTAPTVLVATETGMLHQLRRSTDHTTSRPINDRAVCHYMKMITPAKLLRSLREDVDEVTVPDDIAARARECRASGWSRSATRRSVASDMTVVRRLAAPATVLVPRGRRRRRRIRRRRPGRRA